MIAFCKLPPYFLPRTSPSSLRARSLTYTSFLSSTFAMSGEASGKGILLKADPIANVFRDEIKATLASRSRPPRLVGILATSAAPSKFYAEFTQKQCTALGFEFVLKRVGAAADSALGDGDGVEEAIIEANEDDGVDGIMVGCVLDLSRLYTNSCRSHPNKGLLPDFWRAAGLSEPREC